MGLQAAYAHFHTDFFFQAEDGIRDHCVTGVQTCALPISAGAGGPSGGGGLGGDDDVGGGQRVERSEERRVGKECRDRGLPRHIKNYNTSIDIMGLQAAYANLHTYKESDYFMQRYHDVIS